MIKNTAICKFIKYMLVFCILSINTVTFCIAEENIPKYATWTDKQNITVWIQQHKYSNAVFNGFMEWQNGANGCLKINFVKSPQNADIAIYFVNIPIPKQSTPNSNTVKSGCGYKAVVKHTQFTVSNRHFTGNDNKMESVVLELNEALDEKDIYPLYMQEIGAALGILTDSQTPDDIMSDWGNPKHLTQNDINTIRKLYCTPNNK